MKILLLSAALLFSTLFLFSCKKDNPIPPEDQPQVSLSLEDASCTEAWIKLTTANISLPVDVTLKQDDNIVKTLSLSSADTLLYVDSFLPNHTYRFQSVVQSMSQSSNQLSVSTIDTTSHNRSWEVFYFGDYGHSSIRDITIISENDIWAVGEIYVADTSQNGYTLYNAVHWDGSQWQLKKISMLSSCNPVTFPPLKAICAFSDSNIIITSGGSIGWFNGVTNTPDCSIRPLLTGSINKIWGVSSDNFYTVGNNGFIAHYQNGQWSRIESGTTVNLLDIWGGSDGTLWSCGYTSNYSTTVLLRNSGSGWVKLFEGSAGEQNNGYTINQIAGVWSKNDYRIYLLKSDGIFLQANNNELFLQKQLASFIYGSYDIDGTDDNNIFVSAYRFVGHWNGMTFREYPAIYQENRKYYSIKARGNTVCAGGTDYNGPIFSQAVIVLSK